MLVPDEILRELGRARFLPGLPTRFGTGNRTSRQPGDGIEFEDYKPYEPGDDFHKVDARVYLRTGTLNVRRFSAERPLEVTTIVDVSASMRLGRPAKQPLAIQLAACTAYVALRGGDKVRLVAVGESAHWSPPFQGEARFPQVGEWLSRRKATEASLRASTVTSVLEELRQRPGLVLFISDCLVAGLEDALSSVRASDQTIALLQVLSPEDLDPQLLGQGAAELLDEETHEALITDLSPETYARYTAALDSWRSRLRGTLKRPELHLEVRSDAGLREVVTKLWAAQGLIS